MQRTQEAYLDFLTTDGAFHNFQYLLTLNYSSPIKTQAFGLCMGNRKSDLMFNRIYVSTIQSLNIGGMMNSYCWMQNTLNCMI